MAVYNVVSILCILIMLTIVITIASKIIKFKRPDKISYIRNFKKGKCAIIYVVAVPLFFMSFYYAGSNVFESVLDGLSNSINLIALKFDESTVAALASESVIFSVAIYTCLTLVVLNTIMFTASVFFQAVWAFIGPMAFKMKKGNKLIVIGNNPQGIAVYNSCNCQKLLVGNLTAEDCDKLFIKNVAYKSFVKGKSTEDWFNSDVKSLVKKLKNTKYKLNIIVTEKEEKQRLHYCGQFVEFIKKSGNLILNNVSMYVFGERDFQDVYVNYEKSSNGCLHYINEYDQIAVDFITSNPFTKYMDGEQIDYDTALIKDGVKLSVAMIGFGKVNQQVFTAMVANNQLLTKNNGKIQPAEIEYHCFDKARSGDHKNLNHKYFRYKYNFFDEQGNLSVNPNDYLELPKIPAKEAFHVFDINKKSFYLDLKEIVATQNGYSYVLVSLGDDYLNLDVANKIIAKVKEWKVERCHVFVRIKDKSIIKDADVLIDDNYCSYYGTDAESVYDYSHIVQEKYTEMAIMRNYIYDVEKNMNRSFVSEEEMEKSRYKWYTQRSPLERESNLYACLSIKTKLQLLGLDLVETTSSKVALSEEEFLNVYADGDPLLVDVDESGKKQIKYTIDYKNSKRKNLAMQEHERWNAYMFSQGFVPATKKQIESEIKNCKHTNGKNYEMRYHGNLTTFEGLEEFRKIISSRDNKPESECDVIKYDYQLLDGVYWLLQENGFKIVVK